MEITRLEGALANLRARRPLLSGRLWRGQADASLATLPGGIRLALFTTPFIVRWASWLIALLVVVLADLPEENVRFEPWLLLATFAQMLLVTSYVPVFRPVALPALRRRYTIPDNADVLVLSLIDVAASMMAIYLSGGWRSPYWHFALTALLIPSFFLTFRGVLLLAGAFMAAYFFGLSAFGEGIEGSWTDRNLNSFIGAMVTPLLVAVVPNYLGTLLRDLDAARQDAVDALADSDVLFRVARSFLEGGGDLDETMPKVAEATLEASRFDRIIVLLTDDSPAGSIRGYGDLTDVPSSASTLRAAFEGDDARTSTVSSPLPPPLDAALGDCEWVAVAPLRSSEAVEGWLFAGTLQRPASILHEISVLNAIAGQVALGVRNVRLSERIGELAAEGERTRIAREIHDGIAQMVYMLSLSLETAIDRVGTDPEEQRKRLQDLTALAKNALWEVRQYIFDLRPLLSGDEGIVGAVQGQVKEFQAVADLPVELSVSGTPGHLPMTTSAALYRIVQESLGNIFRHAHASKIDVDLRFAPGCVTLAVVDDGVGMGEGEPGGRTGYGMGNLHQRVEEIGGSLEVTSTPGEGTRIEVSVPVRGEP